MTGTGSLASPDPPGCPYSKMVSISEPSQYIQGKKASTVKNKETCVVWPHRAELLRKRVEHLVPAFLDRDLSYVSMFLGMAISSILGTWLDHYPEDFFQPPEFPCLKMLLAYLGLNMPGSDLERRAQLLFSQLGHLEPIEPEAEAEEDSATPEQDPEPPLELAPAPSAGPAAASQPEPVKAITAAGAQQLERAVMPPAMSGPAQVTVTALIQGQELEEPPVPLAAPETDRLQQQLWGSQKGLSNPLPQCSNQPRSLSNSSYRLQP
ncbi:ral guanine nucleotide dissociation stimulator-like [Zalophus californianus]|uniref:Ral guanine nucleotide dissociation stimulator-like n=1 Tax=Zalophus californianus TaxID=9704 RepID=A0A6J2B2I0_ZALCA|nr:ral guanine nucleotide dissociation stimulator-like [Zalophus californianus]